MAGKGRAVGAAVMAGCGGATGVLLAQSRLKTIDRTKAVKPRAKVRLGGRRSGWGGLVLGSGRIPNKRFSIDRPRPNPHPDLM